MSIQLLSLSEALEGSLGVKSHHGLAQGKAVGRVDVAWGNVLETGGGVSGDGSAVSVAVCRHLGCCKSPPVVCNFSQQLVVSFSVKDNTVFLIGTTRSVK